MDVEAVVTELWSRIQARDWDGVADLIAPDAVVEWPVSRERIVGRENFLSVQSEYPEGWSIQILRVVSGAAEAATEVEVSHEEMGVFRAASFWTVRDGRITGGTEYWSGPEVDSPPQWRAPYVERY